MPASVSVGTGQLYRRADALIADAALGAPSYPDRCHFRAFSRRKLLK